MFEQTEKNKNIRLPFGLRDIFPLESSERNAIKRIIGKEFKRWGYGEVKTPVMEYTENISIGVGKDWKNKLINFLDIDGNLISLRADMTIPIARLAGMRLRKDQLPVRFCYFSDVFRQTGSQVGNKRMFSQAGLEFLGSDKRIDADAEIMIIMFKVLQGLGLEDFRMVMGHVGFIKGLFDWLGIDGDAGIELRRYIIDKDFVRVESLLKKTDGGKAGIFMGLIQPENDLKKISDIVSDIGEEKVSRVFKYLKGLYRILEEQDYGKYLVFDFSIIRDFDYYTGLLFEVYCHGITDIMGSGGRYDNLIKKFGIDIPATGFALDIDMLHGALGEKDLMNDIKIMLLCPGKDDSGCHLMQFADSIRGRGIEVEILYDDIKNSRGLAAEKNCRFLVESSPDRSEIRVIDVKSGDWRKSDTRVFLEEIKKWKKN